jgi:hypothetical protein
MKDGWRSEQMPDASVRSVAELNLPHLPLDDPRGWRRTHFHILLTRDAGIPGLQCGGSAQSSLNTALYAT